MRLELRRPLSLFLAKCFLEYYVKQTICTGAVSCYRLRINLDLTDSYPDPEFRVTCKSIPSLKMAGKHSSDNVSPDKARITTELEREDEDTLLRDDDLNNSVLRTIPVASAKATESLESTLLKLNDNMLLVPQSMSSMQETLARFADGQRHSKRPRVDELSDSGTDSSNNASESDSETLLTKREKSNPTRESKDNLLGTIAKDLNADKQTHQDVSEELAKLANKR